MNILQAKPQRRFPRNHKINVIKELRFLPWHCSILDKNDKMVLCYVNVLT